MDCTEIRSRLGAFLDRELDLESAMAMESHLASCEACRTILARQSALQERVREHARYHRAPAGLEERIRASLGGEGGLTRRGVRRGRWRWPKLGAWLPIGAALAATAVLSWTVAVQYSGVSADDRLAEQVITGHVRSMLTSRLVDVTSSDQHTVKPWLSSKLDFSPPVVDLANAGFALVGGRLDYLDSRPVAALVYRYRQHFIDLFVWPEADGRGEAKLRALSRQGYNVLHWSEGGMAFWAISDVNAADMKTFAEAYAGAK